MARDRAPGRGAGAKKGRASARRAAMIRRVAWTTLVASGIGIFGVLLAREATKGPSVSGPGAIGAPAPEIEMTDFEGDRFALADLEGKPVVMNFFASWCPNCIAEMPDFERVHQDLKDDVVFLGVNQRDDRDLAHDLVAETGVSYRLAEDPTGRVFDAFGALGMPTTVFIGADGRVVDIVTGQLSEQQLRDFIARGFGVEA